MIHNWIKPIDTVVTVEKLSIDESGTSSSVVRIADTVDEAKEFIARLESKYNDLYRIQIREKNSSNVGLSTLLDKDGNEVTSIPPGRTPILWDAHVVNCNPCRDKVVMAAAKKFCVNSWNPTSRTLRNIAHAFTPTGRRFPNGFEVSVILRSSVYCKEQEVSFDPGGQQLPESDEHI